jgi:hypothetical protein
MLSADIAASITLVKSSPRRYNYEPKSQRSSGVERRFRNHAIGVIMSGFEFELDKMDYRLCARNEHKVMGGHKQSNAKITPTL